MKTNTPAHQLAERQPPVTFRLPKNGTLDQWFGGSRTFWNERILPNQRNNFKPPVRSIVVKERNAKRGIRFINFQSAKAYFDALDAQSESGLCGATERGES